MLTAHHRSCPIPRSISSSGFGPLLLPLLLGEALRPDLSPWGRRFAVFLLSALQLLRVGRGARVWRPQQVTCGQPRPSRAQRAPLLGRINAL